MYKAALESIARIIILSISVIVFTSQAYGQISNESGFSWYNSYNDVIHQNCAYTVLLQNGNYYRAFTPWTPPATYQYYTPTVFRAMIGTIPNPDSPSTVLQPPSYTGYSIYIYDSDSAVFGTYDINQLANTNYIKRYDYYPPYETSAQFHDVGSTITYPSGVGNINVELYEALFNLEQPSSQDPLTPIQLQAGHRYWFSIVGRIQTGAEGAICLARTSSQTVPSPLPNPPMSLTMTNGQCANWGQPAGCSFRLANQDFNRIGEVGNNNYNCNVNESYVNTFNAPYAPRLPSPDCLSTEASLVTVCCLRGYAGRQAVGLIVEPVLTPTPTPMPSPSSTATSTPTSIPTQTATPTATRTPIKTPRPIAVAAKVTPV